MFQERASTRRTSTAAAVVALAILAMSAISATSCGEKQGAATTSPAEVKTATAVTAPSAQPSAGAAPPPASAAPAPDEDAPAASARPGARTFDCGARGQKLCPMQKWMKTVMAAASSSDDGDKLAEALTYVANHPPPGFAAWAALATGGAKKARAGDLDGAKVSCKQCHDQFKDKYKTTLRDRPF